MNLLPLTLKSSITLLCLLVQAKIATQVAKVNSAISWGQYGGQAMAAYWGLAPQYATVLGYVGGAVTGGFQVGTALSSVGKPFLKMARGVTACAPPELIAMTNATVVGIAHMAAPIWIPMSETIESIDLTTNDQGGMLHLLWMGPMVLTMGMKAFGKAKMGATAQGQFV